jgi:hypothetical protein
MLKERKTKECQKNWSSFNGRNEERGKPRKRWKDDVEEDSSTMGIK